MIVGVPAPAEAEGRGLEEPAAAAASERLGGGKLVGIRSAPSLPTCVSRPEGLKEEGLREGTESFPVGRTSKFHRI